MQQDRAKPPPADFKIVGGFQRASECLVEGGDNRIDAMAGNGSGQVNASATKERRRTETCLTLMLNLEGRNGLAAATTAYKMTVDKTELNRSVSIYVGGTGIGAGRKVTVTQDLGDALSDAAAAAIIHLLGNAHGSLLSLRRVLLSRSGPGRAGARSVQPPYSRGAGK